MRAETSSKNSGKMGNEAEGDQRSNQRVDFDSKNYFNYKNDYVLMCIMCLIESYLLICNIRVGYKRMGR